MNINPGYSLAIKLLFVPVVAILSFSAYLSYSSLVLSEASSFFKEIKESDFPILDMSAKNLGLFDGLTESLNSAATTGESEYLDIARNKYVEILDRYDDLQKIDVNRSDQVERLKTEFKAYFLLSFEIAQRMSSKSGLPDAEQLARMRSARDAYLGDAHSYKDAAEQEFNATIDASMAKSDSARRFGNEVGGIMLLVIAVLTYVVTRGVLLLEKKVAERNARLAALNLELKREIEKLEEVEAAKSQVEAASQIKDEFLANMSHELRTPMNAVIGLSHLCLQTELSRKQQDYLQKIHGAAQSLLGILNDILDISKIEAGKMDIDQIPFDLEEVMASLIAIVSDRPGEKDLEFVLDIAPEIPFALIGDPLRLGQVLINLAGNALKFTEQGEVRVRVEMEYESVDQVSLRFSVKDTGIGISPDNLSKLFKPFTQADASITRGFGGTGLGLTISRRLIEMMGGNIHVESVLGVGSEFVFTARFQKMQKKGGFRQGMLDELRGLRVLAVDDNASSLKVLWRYLASFGVDVVTAADGFEALSCVASDPSYALAIVDKQMPGMDSHVLMEKLRAAGVPKILLLSSVGQTDLNGVDACLAKPLLPGKLFDALMRLSRSDNSPSGKYKIVSAFDPALFERLRGARLLVVEDNEINQQVVQELLLGGGISAALAHNGAEAVNMVENGHYDGVLMDIQMPVMDGITATRKIRSDPRFSTLPIIALTANVMVSEQGEYMTAGMNDHIGKPIDPEKMFTTLAKWIKPAMRPAEVSTSRGETVRSLPNLPGVAVEESVRRIGGKVGVYYSLLGQFKVKNRDFVPAMKSALSGGDGALAERLAHTLKGVAGTLGAIELQHLAGELEAVVKAGGDADALLGKIDGELVSLIGHIEAALVTTPPDSGR